MPKSTFHNLSIDKKNLIITAFLKEFAVKTYDEASISSVVQKLGISKGSIYQYFEDKMDLFIFLIQHCTLQKNEYIQHLKRADFPDFWTYFRKLFEEGVKFDLEHHLQSHFLYNLFYNQYSPSVKSLFENLLTQILTEFSKMVSYEVDCGLFRSDIPINHMSFMLYKSGINIQEHMQAFGYINPKESITNNSPVYFGKEILLMNTVDHYISLLKSSFNK